MSVESWFLLIGAILFIMALSAAALKRLPLTTAIIYLAAGTAIGPMAGGYFHFNPLKQSPLFEIITEIAVLISLYSAGLKCQAVFTSPLWRVPLRLATLSVLLTVCLVSLLARFLLDLSPGAALLLGAIVAPTDPVLATDVQVNHHRDRDRLRFSLTGEAGLNDGTAFPFVMLGLGLMGLHDLGVNLSRWIVVDLVWASFAGVAVGALFGLVTAFTVHRLRVLDMNSEYMDDFLGLGVIALSYGTALYLQAYGFLAVFAAGYTLHQAEFVLNGKPARPSRQELKNSREHKPRYNREDNTYISQRSLFFNAQLERLVEVVLIVLIGGMLFIDSWQFQYICFALILFLVIRPISVYLGLHGASIPPAPRRLSAWFGVRGIGSMYYLMYAIQQGLPEALAVKLISVVLITVTMSIIIHGITVKPLMNWYSRKGRLWNRPLLSQH